MSEDTKTKRFIVPLYMNGLNGRMLRMPAPTGKKREILLVYGHHASLERMFGFAEVLNTYGAITMPDLPGFGGMESFYKIGETPTLEAYADYLAAFMKLRYKRKRVTIVAMSFSVPLLVRTLQKYPELASKVDIFVSTVGFVHEEDFNFTKLQLIGLRMLTWFGTRRVGALFLRRFVLTGPQIRLGYMLVSGRHGKLKDAARDEQKKRINFEVHLWHCNDVRTRMATIKMMINTDVCGIPLPIKTLHVAPDKDRYFNNHVVEQHMRMIFDDFEMVPTHMPAHAPSIIADAKAAAPYVPKRIKKILNAP